MRAVITRVFRSESCENIVECRSAKIASSFEAVLMARLSRAGHALHRTTLILGGAINYEHSAHEWRNLLSSAASCGAAASSSSSSVIRLAVQSFSGNELNEWTNAAAELRRSGNVSCCELILSARVRAPLAHYLSAYTWATHSEFKPARGIQKRRSPLGSDGHARYLFKENKVPSQTIAECTTDCCPECTHWFLQFACVCQRYLPSRNGRVLHPMSSRARYSTATVQPGFGGRSGHRLLTAPSLHRA